VPALVDDRGRVLGQSMAVIEWLDETRPEPPLMPRDPDERWYVRAVSQLVCCEIHPLNNLRVLRYLKDPLGIEGSRITGEWYPHWIAEGFRALEAFLLAEGRSGRFCLGDTVTMADLCLVPQIFNAQRLDCTLDGHPTVMAIFAECMRLEAYASAEPSAQADPT
jgi:maleylacetoacetate isomerase